MKTYISLIRGINVSGHNIIKMDTLRTLCESLGFRNIRTYIQSGNIVFESVNDDKMSLEQKIRTGIQQQFGYEVCVMIRDSAELKEIIENNPFLTDRKEDISKLHVTLLSALPVEKLVSAIADFKTNQDEFKVIGQKVYLFCPDGSGNSKLSNTFFENKLKLSATTRNWKTINKLFEMATA